MLGHEVKDSSCGASRANRRLPPKLLLGKGGLWGGDKRIDRQGAGFRAYVKTNAAAGAALPRIPDRVIPQAIECIGNLETVDGAGHKA